MLALLLGLSLGTSSCKWQMLCPLLMMMLGVLATIHGELFLSYLGLALLVMAILIEQFLGATLTHEFLRGINFSVVEPQKEKRSVDAS